MKMGQLTWNVSAFWIMREYHLNFLFSGWGEGQSQKRTWNVWEEHQIKDGCSRNRFSSVIQSCPTLRDPMNCRMPGLLVHHQLPEFTQTHVHWVSDVIQPSHPLLSLSPPVFNLSQHRDLFQRASSSHQVAKVLEFQLQHQSFQWISRTDFL